MQRWLLAGPRSASVFWLHSCLRCVPPLWREQLPTAPHPLTRPAHPCALFACLCLQRDANIVYVARDKVKGVPHHAKAGNINSCLLKEGPGKVGREAGPLPRRLACGGGMHALLRLLVLCAGCRGVAGGMLRAPELLRCGDGRLRGAPEPPAGLCLLLRVRRGSSSLCSTAT